MVVKYNKKAYTKPISVPISALICTLILSGCAELKPPVMNDEAFAPVMPQKPVINTYEKGSIYHQAKHVSLFRDRKAHRVGDILTVRLDVDTRGSKSANNSTDKSSDVKAGIPVFFGKAVDNLEFKFGSSQGFSGKAKADQSNRLSGTVTVHVTQVLGNGNLVVKGQSWVHINRGQEFIRFMGVVRPDDITRNNEVSSQRVASARISYSGKGAFAASNRQGAIQRAFTKYFPY